MFRASLITICGLLSVSPAGEPGALLVLLPLALGAWAAYRSVTFANTWPFVAGTMCACAIPFTGGGRSPLLPYLLASGLTLGLTHGIKELLAISSATAAILLAGPLVTDVGALGDYFIGAAQWVVLALAVGLVPVWSRRLRLLPHHPDDYSEVRHLLEQVRSLARHLPGSLDATAAAEALLRRCCEVSSADRAAVIAQTGHDVFVPLAVVGVSRVPWRTPLAEDGPLRDAWVTGQPARDSRRVDIAGRRRGSTVLAIPLPTRHGPLGLVVLESMEIDAFAQNLIDQLTELVVAATPQIETALMFDEVKVEASSEERDRLAREMHDGIGQELAVLGYQLDQLAMRAQVVDDGLAQEIGAVRGELTTLMSELRLSITDLRTTVHPGRGLGSALSTYLPAVCSGRDIVLNLSLDESPFRLPADQEVALLKAAQLFAQEVRRTRDARILTVGLWVDPPSAALSLSSDVPLPALQMDEIRKLFCSSMADVALSVRGRGEPSLMIALKGPDDDHTAAGGRPRADSARPAASVRAN